jgi:hypothetical protein
MEAIYASETSGSLLTAWRYNPQDRTSGVAAGGHVLLGSPCRISVRTGTRPDLALDAKANFWSEHVTVHEISRRSQWGGSKENRARSSKLTDEQQHSRTSHESSVDVALGYRLDRPRKQVSTPGKRFFSSPQRPKLALGPTQPGLFP